MCSTFYKMDVYVIVLCYIYPNLSLFIHNLKSQGSVHLLRKYPAGLWGSYSNGDEDSSPLGCGTISIGKWLLSFWSGFLCPSSIPISRKRLKLWRSSLVGLLAPEDTSSILLKNSGNSTIWHSVASQKAWIVQKVACLDKSSFLMLLLLHMICDSEVILWEKAVNSGQSDTRDLAVWITSPKLLFEVVVKLFTLFN